MIINREKYFVKKLIDWDTHSNTRKMPWKAEKNPYKIWLSEIILQQTRVQQGWAYYEKFLQYYPVISNLAQAKDSDVFKLWEGLGYYNRCKNLLETARYIHNNLNNTFPNTYINILSLKGIGPYTAAAIASFAYNLPYAVVDGNVMRVLARYFGLHQPIDTTEGKKMFTLLAEKLLPTNKSAIYNQAIMDFGATICKPIAPLCAQCPVNKNCVALQNMEVNLLPIKEKKLILKERYFHYFFANYNNKIYIRKRGAADIWQNLHEPILIDSLKQTTTKAMLAGSVFKAVFGKAYKLIKVSDLIKQKLTHQHLFIYIYQIELGLPLQLADYVAISKRQLKQLAFPRKLQQYVENNF